MKNTLKHVLADQDAQPVASLQACYTLLILWPGGLKIVLNMIAVSELIGFKPTNAGLAAWLFQQTVYDLDGVLMKKQSFTRQLLVG